MRDLPPVRADFSRIKDVLVRLIENADAYSPKDSADHDLSGSERIARWSSASPITARASKIWNWD